MFWGKSPKTVLRSAFDALLDVEAVWGIASSLGLSSLVVAWGRSASTWYLKLDPAGQAVAGIGAFLILYAASFTAWRLLGRKVLYWVRRRFFPVDVSASLGPRSLYLAVRNRTSSQRFRGDVNWVPVTSDDHLPVALTWKQSNEETREIIRNGRADLLMCDFYFVPPHTRDRQYRPLFHFSIPTPTGDTIEGEVPITPAEEDEDDWTEVRFRVEIGGDQIGVVEEFVVHVGLNWRDGGGVESQIEAEVTPAPGFPWDGPQSGKNYFQGEWDELPIQQ